MANIDLSVTPKLPDTHQDGLTLRESITLRNVSLGTLFSLAVITAIAVAKPFLLPVIMAMLFNFLLRPLHKALVKLHLPAVIAAALIMLTMAGGVGWGVFKLSEPAMTYMQTLPGQMRAMEGKLRSLTRPVKQMSAMAAKVDEITAMKPDTPQEAADDKAADDQAAAEDKAAEAAKNNPSGETPAGVEGDKESEAKPEVAAAQGNGSTATPSGEADRPPTTVAAAKTGAHGKAAGTKPGPKAANDTGAGTPKVSVLVNKASPPEGFKATGSTKTSGSKTTVEATATLAAVGTPGTADEAKPQTVEVKIDDTKTSDALFGNLQAFLGYTALTLVLLFFMLGYGDVFYRQFAQSDETFFLVEGIAQSVSKYLLTITIINVCLGIAIGAAMWFIGLPNPMLWGLMATAVNYVPFLGAMVGIVIVGIVGLLNFTEPSHALMAPLAYFIICNIEGNFITPMIVGKHFTINPIIILVWLMFWSWIWGVPGALIAVPLLMAFHIFANNFKPLMRLARIMSLDPVEVSTGVTAETMEERDDEHGTANETLAASR